MKHRMWLGLGLLFVVSAWPAACFRQVEETRQVDEGGAIVFTGNFEGAQATIDGQAVVNLSTEGAPPKRFKIEPGTHRVLVKRGGTVLVEREIFVGDGQTFEVAVP